MPATTRPLVGRSTELSGLLDVLDRAAESGRASVLLSGDAGVGKTRLLTEVLSDAGRREMIQLVGHCIDYGDVGLPYLPFSEAFGRLARQRPDMATELQVDFAPIGRLLPPRRMIGAETAGQDAKIERSDLFDAVLGALARIGGERPSVLVIEDAHWADQSSRDLLGFLLNRLEGERVALMVSYRGDDLHRRHPLRSAVAEWSRLPGIRRIQLAPLGEDDVRALISSLHPAPLAERAIAHIVQRAEGNPFFTEELLAATEESDPDGESGAMVPAALADLLLVRLDKLSTGAQHVVRIAAVAGRQVPHQVLESVAGLSPTELDAAVREAVDSHILQPRGHSRYGFRHALLGEAVYDDLLPGERVRLHTEFVAALAKESVPGTAAELARHARESYDLDTAFTASVRAGDEALAVGAPQEAMRHYEAAGELLPRLSAGLSAGLPVDPVRLALTTAEAAAAAGHPTRALAFVREALNGLPADAAASARARLLLAVATHAAAVEGELEALAASGEGLKLVPGDQPTGFRAQLAAAHARTLSQLGRDDEAARWAHEAVATAEAAGHPELSTDARTTLAVVENRAGDPVAARDRFEVIAAQARASGQIGDELRTRFQIGVLSLAEGDLASAETAYTECWQRARATGRPWATYGLDARCHLAGLYFSAGQWDASQRVADFVGERPPRLAEAKLVAAGFAVRVGRGDVSVLEQIPMLRKRWDADGLIAIMSLSHVVDLHAQRTDHEAAMATLDELVEVITDLWQQPWFGARLRVSAVGLAALSASIGGLGGAARSALVERGARLHAEGAATVERGMLRGREPGPEGRAWTVRLDAEWARLRWLADIDPPDGDSHIDVWSRGVAAFGLEPYESARCRARLATVLRAAGRTAEATEQARMAAATAGSLGAAPLLDELGRSAGTARPAEAGPAGISALTSREQDVLGLLVEGRTNRQIARHLYISEKTVSVHVSNILGKLGVHSRTEAAAVARRD